jgi:hypothetical protein
MDAARPDRERREDGLDDARPGATPSAGVGREAMAAIRRPGTSTLARQAALEYLQTTAGNHAVGMLLREPDFQLPTPWLLGGERPTPRLGGDLRLDLNRMASAEAEIAARLSADSLLAQIGRVRLGVPPPAVGEPGSPDVITGADPRAGAPAPAPATAPTPQGSAAPVPPVPPFTQTRAGTVGDLIDAITVHPSIAPGLARVKDDALRAFRAAPPGERAFAIVSVLTFSGLAVGGALATPGGRDMLGRLSGNVLPVPGVDWLHLEFNSEGDNHVLGVHVDVGGLLPPSWGFGSAGPGQGPAPMTPSATGRAPSRS